MAPAKISNLDKIVHELNGHIHSIGFAIDIMLDSRISLTAEEARKSLRHIQTSTEKLTKLVASLPLNDLQGNSSQIGDEQDISDQTGTVRRKRRSNKIVVES